VIRPAALFLCCLLGSVTAQAAPRDDLLAADQSFAKLSETKGWGFAILATAANDARLVGPGGEQIYGRAQALRSLARPIPGTLRWEPETASVSADSKLGWTDGRWERTLKDAKVSGRYLSVWAKARNGAWKVQASVSTADPAPKK
jgi:ketosteroid isomerase-like protein